MLQDKVATRDSRGCNWRKLDGLEVSASQPTLADGILEARGVDGALEAWL